MTFLSFPLPFETLATLFPIVMARSIFFFRVVVARMCARGLANVVYGAARSGCGESLGVLFEAVALSVEHINSQFSPQHIANMARAFATAGGPKKI